MKKRYPKVEKIGSCESFSRLRHTSQREHKFFLTLRRVYATLSLVLWLATLSAQQPIGLIFRISAEEARQLYKQAEITIPDAYFHTLVDSFGVEGYHPQARQQHGHYLLVRANGEHLDVSLQSRHSQQLTTINNDRDLMIRVVDKSGDIDSTASIKLGRKKIQYDPITKSYRLKKRNRGGFLEVQLQRDTLFYQVEPNDTKWLISKRYRHFTKTRWGYYLNSPIRWGSQIYHYFSRLIQYGRWKPRWILSSGKSRSLHGYMVTHKPKYQPGDTLRLKAFASSPKGQPIKRELQLSIRNYYQRRPILDTLLTPITAGAFHLKWAIPDSVQLDQKYSLSIKHPKRRKLDGLSHSFSYEAYELDQVVYDLQVPQDTFHPGEQYVLTASAKDQNGLPIFDTRVKLHLIVDHLLSFHADELLIPDTLWSYTGELATAGQVDISVPDSLLPAARLQIRVVAEFTNSNGEIQEKRSTFYYSPLQEKIHMELHQGRLIGTFLRGTRADTITALLIQTSAMDNRLDSLSVQLPLNIPLSVHTSSYRLVAGKTSHEIHLGSKFRSNHDGVQLVAALQGDSLQLQLQNPHQVRINWLIRYHGGSLSEGSTQARRWEQAWLAKKDRTYFLKYQYEWGGRIYNKEQEVLQYKKLLQIQLDQPKQITPGQETRITVRVKDYEGQPAAGVHLAAGAINAQLGTHEHLSPASIPYKRGVGPMDYNRFQLRRSNAQERPRINKRWYEDLQLDHSHYYRLRFPRNGVYFQYDSSQTDSFYQTLAQFAPFLVKDGKCLPIHMIYCNRRLVYYYDASKNAPYSFQGIEGLNKIVIRTTEAEVTIDSVILKKGQKLEFSIDLQHYLRWEKAKRITIQKMPNYLTESEKRLLNQSILVLKRPADGTTLIWDEAQQIHSFNKTYSYRKDSQLGPFLKGSRLHYRESNGHKNTFLFEPRFSYDLSDDQPKLYEYDLFANRSKVFLPSYTIKGTPGQWLYNPKEILVSKPSIPIQHMSKTNAPTGQYLFTYTPDHHTILGIVLQLPEQDSIVAAYPPSVRRLRAIPVGTYLLSIIRSDYHLYQTLIDIRANTTLYQRLSEDFFKLDANSWISNLPLSLNTRVERYRPTPPNPKPWPYPGNRRTVSGYIRDESGEPLIGASILIQGTTQGTVTDIDGRYELDIQQEAPTLIVSYVGFATTEIQASGSVTDIKLSSSPELLEKVVVTGYGASTSYANNNLYLQTPNLMANTSSHTSLIQDMLQGRLGGVQITDAGTNILIRGASTGQTGGPLFIIDGKVGDPSKLLPSQIRNIRELGAKEAQAIYGSKAMYGAILITTNLIPELDIFLLENTRNLRSDFKDYAYWQPNVITDKNGEASFQVTFPDNITRWKAYAIGMDKKRRSGVGFAETRAFQPIMAQLAVPRFLTEGDQAYIIGKSLNYTSDSVRIKTRFLSSDTLLSQQESWLKNGKVESTDIHAGMAGDSLAITYSLTAGEDLHTDGEKRSIPVLKKGTPETLGTFHVLDQDTIMSLHFPEKTGKLDLYLEQDLLSVLIREIDFLKQYKYGCNEQTASKLIALCLEKSLRAQLGEPFSGETQIRKCLQRLEKNQNEAGTWGWWRKSEGRDWVTRHVVKALLLAEEMGYSSKALDLSLRNLTQQFKAVPTPSIIPSLLILAQAKQNFPYEETLAQLDTQSLTLAQQFEIIRIRQWRDLPYQLDSLYHYRKATLLGSHYWGSPSYGFPGNTIYLCLLAHDILTAADKPDEAFRIKTYFLENRRHTGRRHAWRNTLETAMVLHSILPGLLDDQYSPKKPPIVELSGLAELKIDSFPAQLELPLTSDNLQLKKSGSSRIYLTAYQSFFNGSPEKVDSIFKVSTHLEQDGKRIQTVVKGKKMELIVEVESEKEAAYLMLEVPIPGACSYYSKPNGRRGIEVHREYAIEQTSIFVELLPPGRHQFTIALEPRFSGHFTLNPAKVEQMYFPTFYGREAIKHVEVLED